MNFDLFSYEKWHTLNNFNFFIWFSRLTKFTGVAKNGLKTTDLHDN
jgi:hypothetical protein